MIITKPYLIQRGVINRPLADASNKLSNAVNLDYMGSAEFEFGALPKSLRVLQANKAVLVQRKLPQIMQGESQLRVVTFMDDEQWAEYSGCLVRLRTNKPSPIRTKEGTRFDVESLERSARLGLSSTTDFWWDIQNHVMWSFDKQFMNRLPEYLQSSWAYMDAQK